MQYDDDDVRLIYLYAENVMMIVDMTLKLIIMKYLTTSKVDEYVCTCEREDGSDRNGKYFHVLLEMKFITS